MVSVGNISLSMLCMLSYRVFGWFVVLCQFSVSYQTSCLKEKIENIGLEGFMV